MLDLGRKVFVSYKYKDSNVKAISGVMQPTWPCDYVDYIKNKILSGDDVYKGEKVMKTFLLGVKRLSGSI